MFKKGVKSFKSNFFLLELFICSLNVRAKRG